MRKEYLKDKFPLDKHLTKSHLTINHLADSHLAKTHCAIEILPTTSWPKVTYSSQSYHNLFVIHCLRT